MKIVYYMASAILLMHGMPANGMKRSINDILPFPQAEGLILKKDNRTVGTMALFLVHYDNEKKEDDCIIPMQITCWPLKVENVIEHAFKATSDIKDSRIDRVAIITENEVAMIADGEKLSNLKKILSENTNLQLRIIKKEKNILYELSKINNSQASIGVKNYEISKEWRFELQLDNNDTENCINIPIIYSPEVAKIINSGENDGALKSDATLPRLIITTLDRFIHIIGMELNLLPKLISGSVPL